MLCHAMNIRSCHAHNHIRSSMQSPKSDSQGLGYRRVTGRLLCTGTLRLGVMSMHVAQHCATVHDVLSTESRAVATRVYTADLARFWDARCSILGIEIFDV